MAAGLWFDSVEELSIHGAQMLLGCRWDTEVFYKYSVLSAVWYGLFVCLQYWHVQNDRSDSVILYKKWLENRS